MRTLNAIAALLLMQSFAQAAAAQSRGGADLSLPDADAADLAGRWIVTWLDNGTKNPMSLTLKDGRFSGTYVNDTKDDCSVSGNLRESDRRVAFQVVCPKWDMRMQGVVSADYRTIDGTYQAYIDSGAKFTMTRE